jgi:hypothetical protein
MAISGAYESRIMDLQCQIECERKEKEELQAKYVSNLKEMEKEHQEKIAGVYKQRDNQPLRDSAVKLVDSLDVLRRALGKRDLLE